MENYFWVAVQTHCYEGKIEDDSYRTLRMKDVIDVLALAGPNMLYVDMPTKVTCVVKAMISRAFELALIRERQQSIDAECSWTEVAEDFIGELLPTPCQAKPCPIFGDTELGDIADAHFRMTNRTPIDVSNFSAPTIEILRWALADLDSPLTALGRAWGSRKYALVGATVRNAQESSHLPPDIWTSILSILHDLGVENLTTRLERAALFVWDLVACSVHTGLKNMTVIDPQQELCRCSVCAGALLTLKTESNDAALSDECVHSCWSVRPRQETNDDCRLRSIIKLGAGRTKKTAISIPTLETLKLRTIKDLAHFEDLRYEVWRRLHTAGLRKAEIDSLRGELLREEMRKVLSRKLEAFQSISSSLVGSSNNSGSVDLLLQLDNLGTVTSLQSLTQSHIKAQMDGNAGWVRRESVSRGLLLQEAQSDMLYQQVPCRLICIPIRVDPRLFVVPCEIHKSPTAGPSQGTQDSYRGLSTYGDYSRAVWKLIKREPLPFEGPNLRETP